MPSSEEQEPVSLFRLMMFLRNRERKLPFQKKQSGWESHFRLWGQVQTSPSYPKKIPLLCPPLVLMFCPQSYISACLVLLTLHNHGYIWECDISIYPRKNFLNFFGSSSKASLVYKSFLRNVMPQNEHIEPVGKVSIANNHMLGNL